MWNLFPQPAAGYATAWSTADCGMEQSSFLHCSGLLVNSSTYADCPHLGAQLAAVPLQVTMSRIWKPIISFSVLLCLITAAPVAAVVAKHGMVAAEHPLAADAGVRILKAGGNAVDAAVATALAVGVANPSSCGIGGGGFMLIYIGKRARSMPWTSAKRPPAVKPSLYMRDGKPDEQLLRSGPLAIGVPGEVAGLRAALKRFGTMSFPGSLNPRSDWRAMASPAGDHLAMEISRTAPALAHDDGLKAVFLHPDGSPRKAGETITQTDLAATLQSLDDHPDANFYHRGNRRQARRLRGEQGRRAQRRRSRCVSRDMARTVARRLPGLPDLLDAAAVGRRRHAALRRSSSWSRAKRRPWDSIRRHTWHA